jgi:hypothetical protein
MQGSFRTSFHCGAHGGKLSTRLPRGSVWLGTAHGRNMTLKGESRG